MANKKEISVKVGTPLCSILTIIFVIAKIMGAIDWSWWWVFSPIWIPILLGLGIIVVVLIVALIVALFNK